MQRINEDRTREILQQAQGKCVAVIGDVMLDRYFWGNVSRISPEAPVPVIDVESETFHLGGAANVAKNLKTLGVTPYLYGLIGDDNSGKMFLEIANNFGINTDGLIVDGERPTTVKTRIIGNNQQIARLDREVRSNISKSGVKLIVEKLRESEYINGIIFEDYNKGTITPDLIEAVMELAKEREIPVFVDPKKENFFDFKNTTVFKPNRKEASQALGFPIKNVEDAKYACKILIEKINCESVLLTLGAEGMLLYQANTDELYVRTKARNVADVSGAGDTAIATLSVALCGGATLKEGTILANFASGFVCEKPGIIAIQTDELIESVMKN